MTQTQQRLRMQLYIHTNRIEVKRRYLFVVVSDSNTVVSIYNNTKTVPEITNQTSKIPEILTALQNLEAKLISMETKLDNCTAKSLTCIMPTTPAPPTHCKSSFVIMWNRPISSYLWLTLSLFPFVSFHVVNHRLFLTLYCFLMLLHTFLLLQFIFIFSFKLRSKRLARYIIHWGLQQVVFTK